MLDQVGKNRHPKFKSPASEFSSIAHLGEVRTLEALGHGLLWDRLAPVPLLSASYARSVPHLQLFCPSLWPVVTTAIFKLFFDFTLFPYILNFPTASPWNLLGRIHKEGYGPALNYKNRNHYNQKKCKEITLRLGNGARASKTRQTFCAKEHFYTSENRKCNKCSNSMETSVPHSIPTVLGLEVVEVDTILGLPSAKNWCEGSCHTKNANKVGF